MEQDPQPESAPLFRLSSGAFTRDAVLRELETRLLRVGILPDGCRGHSFRKGQPRRLTTTASLKRKSKRSVDGLPTLSNDTSKQTGSALSGSIDSSKLASSESSPLLPTFTSPPYLYLSFPFGAPSANGQSFRQLFTTRSALQG